MRNYLLFIFLLFSIFVFSQEEINQKRMHFASITPDSLLNMKVLHYAQELGYIDRGIQKTYDTATFFIVHSIISKGIKLDIYLFSFPSQLSHSPWGIAIKWKNDYFLYNYSYLPSAILKVIYLTQWDKSAYIPAILSIYDLLSCSPEDGTETKYELKEKARYYYYISNWIHIFKMNDFDYLQRSKTYCLTYNPTTSLDLVNNLSYEENKQITQWIQISYGKKFSYKAYRIFNTKRSSLYLIEIERDFHKEYDFLFKKEEFYDFYQINGSFIPIMYTLKSFFNRNDEALFKGIECLCLSWLYYYSV